MSVDRLVTRNTRRSGSGAHTTRRPVDGELDAKTREPGLVRPAAMDAGEDDSGGDRLVVGRVESRADRAVARGNLRSSTATVSTCPGIIARQRPVEPDRSNRKTRVPR